MIIKRVKFMFVDLTQILLLIKPNKIILNLNLQKKVIVVSCSLVVSNFAKPKLRWLSQAINQCLMIILVACGMIILKTYKNYLKMNTLCYEKHTHELKSTLMQIHIHDQKYSDDHLKGTKT